MQNILWRVQNGELDGVNPKVVVLQAGTNNLGNASAADMTQGLQALIAAIRLKAPEATLIVTGIFPRNDRPAALPVIAEVNRNLAQLADGAKVRFLNINGKLADAQGKLHPGMTHADQLHLAEKGYQVWADALKPLFRELLGEPQPADQAPPPTGDPSAASRR